MKGSGDTGLAIGGLFGAGMFVTTVVVGSISIIKPFKAMERPFLRDIIFYLVGVYWTFFILWRQRIYLYEAIGFMCLYILYVVVVVISGLIYRKQKKAADRKKAGETGDIKLQSIKRKISSGADSAPAEIENSLQKALYLDLSPEHVGHDNFSFEEGTGKRYFTRQDSELSMLPVTPSSPASPNSVSSVTFNLNGDLASNERLSLRSSNSTSDLINNEIKHSMDPIFEKEIQTEKDALENFEAPPTPFRQFLLAICPISLDDWPEMGIIGKVYEIFKSPIQFILTITIPVVNYDVEETHNWNRHLNILHCFWTPTVFILLLQGIDVKIAGVFPIYGLTLLLGLALAIIVFLTSKNETKPKYHWVFGYAGFLGSMVWIYTIANEIVNLLENFGLVFNISNAILGLTLLAWGNSIGDFISNITMSSQGFSRMGFAACFGAPSFNMIANIAMARQGFSRMGFAACYGAPSFNLLLGVGIPFLTSMLQDEETSAELKLTSQQLVLSFFLLASLVSSLVLLPLFRFKAGKVYGIYLITLYLVFLVVALLVEARVIKF